MLRRRPLLAASAALVVAPASLAQGRRSPGTEAPLWLGVDHALMESGLARSLQRGFGADTGIAVKLAPGPALAVLEAVKEGEVDAALCNAPDAEARLETQGLVHDRRPIATGEFVLVGPPPRPARGQALDRSPFGTLARIRDQAEGEPGSVTFLSANDGSGGHVLEQSLWRGAGIGPVAPWYAHADPTSSFTNQVRARRAYALVERGAWGALGGAPLAVLSQGDTMLLEAVHAMRSFRASHPAGKIFIAWIGGGRGHAVAAAQRGYRAPGR